MIPEIFHLTWKTGETRDLSPLLRRNFDAIRRLYPSHEIRVYDDRRLMEWAEEHYPEYVRDVFSRMPELIMKIDTIRYMWMHVCGGIYCDTDIEFLRRVEFGGGAVFVEREWTYPRDDSITRSVHNCIFASEPGHPVWTRILDGIARNVGNPNSLSAKLMQRFFRKRQILNTAGPNAISRILSSMNEEELRGVSVLPGGVFFQRKRSKAKQGHDIVHHCYSSWTK